MMQLSSGGTLTTDMEDGNTLSDAAPSGAERATRYTRSYVNDVFEALKAAKRPLHLRELANMIGEKRNRRISLGSLKVCLSRYLEQGNSSKVIVRVSPGVFALKEWFEGAGDDPNSLSILSLRLLGAALGLDSSSGTAEEAPSRQLAMADVYVWTVPADIMLGFDAQRVYVRANSEEEARQRLKDLGVLRSERGRFQPAKVWVDAGVGDPL